IDNQIIESRRPEAGVVPRKTVRLRNDALPVFWIGVRIWRERACIRIALWVLRAVAFDEKQIFVTCLHTFDENRPKTTMALLSHRNVLPLGKCTADRHVEGRWSPRSETCATVRQHSAQRRVGNGRRLLPCAFENAVSQIQSIRIIRSSM